SSHGSDFNFDYNVSFSRDEAPNGKVTYNFETVDYMFDELPGISVFCKDESGSVFHTYSSYARGGDLLLGAYNYLDRPPKGRNEVEGMEWVRHHDRYGKRAKRGETDPISEFREKLTASR